MNGERILEVLFLTVICGGCGALSAVIGILGIWHFWAGWIVLGLLILAGTVRLWWLINTYRKIEKRYIRG